MRASRNVAFVFWIMLVLATIGGCTTSSTSNEDISACDSVQDEYATLRTAAKQYESELAALGPRPPSRSRSTTDPGEDWYAGIGTMDDRWAWDQERRRLTAATIAQWRLVGRVVVNHAECFDASEVAKAQEYLDSTDG